ncbi:hypothetical protein Q5P01_010516 [Channa striata]|uniref:Uncharacterized protein n=1 Tax=Channa striata TaxID=64152 RepID=A0AA88MYT1_CHASR|nr:hypothetical protein Q5P01_010516 [Channa striata]
MKGSFPPCSLIRDSLACHQSNGATNTAAYRDEREGFPETPDCSIKHQRHTGREIEEEETERGREGGRERPWSGAKFPSTQHRLPRASQITVSALSIAAKNPTEHLRCPFEASSCATFTRRMPVPPATPLIRAQPLSVLAV